jgi:hypothetical protein
MEQWDGFEVHGATVLGINAQILAQARLTSCKAHLRSKSIVITTVLPGMTGNAIYGMHRPENTAVL